MGTSVCGHTGKRTHQSVCTSVRGHISPWAHWSEDTSVHGHIRQRTHQSMGTSVRGHISPWAHRSDDTSVRGHIVQRTHQANTLLLLFLSILLSFFKYYSWIAPSWRWWLMPGTSGLMRRAGPLTKFFNCMLDPAVKGHPNGSQKNPFFTASGERFSQLHSGGSETSGHHFWR